MRQLDGRTAGKARRNEYVAVWRILGLMLNHSGTSGIGGISGISGTSGNRQSNGNHNRTNRSRR